MKKDRKLEKKRVKLIKIGVKEGIPTGIIGNKLEALLLLCGQRSK